MRQHTKKIGWSLLALPMAGAALFLLVALASPVQAGGKGQEKVEICHIPPGNPDNAHTIVVGAPAVPAHLAHGDFEGDCSLGED